MPGLDRVIDPETRDYVDAAGGEYEETPTIRTGCYHQLKTERGRWCGGPDDGSDLHLAMARGVSRDGVVLANEAIKRALFRFIESGEATDLRVAIVGTAEGRFVGETSITDVQGGELDILQDIAPIGDE